MKTEKRNCLKKGYAKSTKMALISVAALLGIVFNADAQSLTANNDTLRTGPLQKVRKDIIRNDVIPGDIYNWRILDPAGAYGIISGNGDFLVFTPGAGCRNTSFDVRYELSGGGIRDTAIIHIAVSQYNNPVNVINADLECVTQMPSGVNFKPALKYVGKSVNTNCDDTDRLDGFSMPLVGDLNGDGKPEIIAMGMSNGSTASSSLLEGLSGTGDKIIILNGQTGREIYRYDLSNLGGSYKLRWEPRHNSISKLAIADLDRNGIGDIIVTETGPGGQVFCIEPVYNSAGTITGMTRKWTGWTGNTSTVASYKSPVTSPVINPETVYSAPLPYISDLNGDGTPEVIVYNKIYNGVTGELVCALQTLNDFGYPSSSTTNTIKNSYAYVGRRPGANWVDDHIPCMAIADINGDDILDIVAGSKVYIMKDDGGKPALDRIIHGPSEITAQRGTGSGTTKVYTSDGFTAVADIDLDGNPDVIVLSPAASGLKVNTENLLYVWDPMSSNPATPKAATYLYTCSATGTMSYPFVGDINGRLDDFSGTKRLPEICFNGGRFYTSNGNASQIAFHPLSNTDLSSTTAKNGFNKDSNSSIRGHIVGFTWHANPDGSTPLHQRLKLSWAMEHGDESSCTGITMFDFDNDNIKELCYRDERSVRVISPARKVYIPNTETESPDGAIRFKYDSGIGSFTGFEAPVIADVNMDGSADIVTLVHNQPQYRQSKGFVHVFEHAAGTDAWAPCPPVWNQGIYFPLQINEDLTVPAKPQSMLTPYKDSDGNLIYPYNGQWIQQPIIRAGENYGPQVRYPDAIIADMKVAVNGAAGATVTLRIVNSGSASIASSVPVNFYNGGLEGVPPASATLIAGMEVGDDIFAGESAVRTYTLAGDFNGKLIYACVMVDNTGSLAAGWHDCDPGNNMMAGIDCPYMDYRVVAAGDTALCGYNDTILLRAEANHAIPANITPTYQWWQGYRLLPGETSQTLKVGAGGEYRCYVVEDVCRGFSPTRHVPHLTPEAHDDRVMTLKNHPALIDVLANDTCPGCTPTPVILTGAEHGLHHGTAVVAGNAILYTPADPDYAGTDSLHYDIGSVATVHIRIAELPDNVVEADCAVPIKDMEWVIDPVPARLGNDSVSTFQTPCVGDLDGDGHVEIVVAKSYVYGGGSSPAYGTNGIFVFDMANSSSRQIPAPDFSTQAKGPVGLARPHADSTGYIVVAALDGYLYAFDKAGKRKWKSDNAYTTYSKAGDYKSATVIFSDFNGDGYAETVTGDRIFDLASGRLLLDCGFLSARNLLGPKVSVVDVDRDGRPELVFGGKVYSINLTSRAGTQGNSCTLRTDASGASANDPSLYITATIPADFDLDGRVDILACENGYFHIYDPVTGNVKVRFNIPAAYQGLGTPSVGDIDGDKYPEIIFGESPASGGKYYISAWKVDVGNASVSRMWHRATNDASRATGVTLFNFDQDEKSEILCRDMESLKIFSGESQADIARPLDSIPCYSGTMGEYPVVADVDNDGEAEIVVTGTSGAATDSRGYVYIFKAGANTRWAPARRVWNQYAYNAVNINEDLTVPGEMYDVATVMAGPDSLIGTAGDNAHPYNGYLKQSTTIDRYGNMVMYTSDAFVTGAPRYVYDSDGDSLTVSFAVSNGGLSSLHSPLYATAYRGGILSDNAVATDSITAMLHRGDTLAFRLTVRNYSVRCPSGNLVIRLNDRGKAVHVQTECSYDNNIVAFANNGILAASHDYAVTIRNRSVAVAVLQNDLIPAGCTLAVDSITVRPRFGTAVIAGAGRDSIRYTPGHGLTGGDTLAYRIVCGSDTAVARVYVFTAEKPDNISDAECYMAPDSTVWGIRELKMNPTAISNFQQVLAGDIDGDGEVEIIAYQDGSKAAGRDNSRYNYPSDGLRMFVVRDDSVIEKRSWKFINNNKQLYASSLSTMAIARHDNKPYIIIAATDGRLYSFDCNGYCMWGSTYPPSYASKKVTNDVVINLADFEGDGNPEIYFGNKLYWMTNLRLLFAGNSDYNVDIMGYTAIGDMDGDGRPEIISGNRIYKVNIGSTAAPEQFSLTEMTGGYALPAAALPPHVAPDSCRTQVADFDLDGRLEALVVTADTVTGSPCAYLWKPEPAGTSAQLLGSYVKTSVKGARVGPPLVGNIDSTAYPEAVFIASADSKENMLVYALKYDPSRPAGDRLVEKWTMPHTDESGVTGMSLFDFNLDGSQEICYRDQTAMRIINGSGTEPAIYATFDNVMSGTRMEMPIIADVDGDGQAELIVNGHTSISGESGFIRVFKAPVHTRWAPARRVWNQYGYSSLNVHDDLTVTAQPASPALRLPGKNGIPGDGDDMFPFNSVFQQQTMLDSLGNPLWLTPDAVFDGGALTVALHDGDSLRISFGVVNRGDAALGSPVCVTLYRDSVGTGNVIATDSITGYLHPGDTVRMTVGTDRFASLPPFTQLVVRLNDRGDGAYPVQQECDCGDSIRTRANPALHLMMNKASFLDGARYDGTYICPAPVLFGENIRYEITAVNANLKTGTVVITDTLPAYMKYMDGTGTEGVDAGKSSGGTPRRQILEWKLTNVPSLDTVTVSYKTELDDGASASQPLFINRAWVTVSDSLLVQTNSTYHQGAGVGIITFSASAGGRIFNAEPQALDYRTSPGGGVLAVPDDGYRFTGWRHSDYVSLRGETVKARAGIMRYDTLTVYGNVGLTAAFAPEEYAVRYCLNDGGNAPDNPPSYTVESAAITLKAPRKAGDVFTGWTGSNGDDPQLSVTIPSGSTGERTYYANYLYSGRENVLPEEPKTDNIWSSGSDAYIRASQPGGIVRIYTPGGVLSGQHTIRSAGITKIRLARGIYFVTLDYEDGRKIVIND
jgi:uncharacterized repeat protein (TIGR02543 family)